MARSSQRNPVCVLSLTSREASHKIVSAPCSAVLGEVRQAEALDLLIALNSGMSGMATIHANSASEAINKLMLLPLLGGPNIQADFVKKTVGQVIDFVIHIERNQTGFRQVAEIIEISI